MASVDGRVWVHRLTFNQREGCPWNLTLYAYDASGRLIQTTDSGGRPTFISYDVYGNVSQVVDRFGKGEFFPVRL